MNREQLLKFLLKARTKTYAGSGGEVKSVLAGSKQLEYEEDEFLYRDIYYVGAGKFNGIETIYLDDEPIWSMSYYGNFSAMSEKEVDEILREALIKNWQKARLWNRVVWRKDNFKYICQPQKGNSIEEIIGEEQILKNEKLIYYLNYAGGLLIDD